MSGAPAFPWPSILGHLGADVGALCIIATDMRIRTRSIVPSTTGITRVAIDYYLADAGDVAEDAHLLAAGVVANVIDNGATPGAAYRHDNGASSDNGATICLMADIDATLWRGYPDLRLQLRHSNNHASNYTNLGAALDVQRDDDGAVVIEIAAGTTIRQYLAVRFLFHGTRDAWQLEGAHVMGSTDLTIDGAAATARPEPGQTFTINANPYEIVSAEETSVAGTWDIVIESPGLVADANNNVAVLVTGSNVSLRYAAAIKRR